MGNLYSQPLSEYTAIGYRFRESNGETFDMWHFLGLGLLAILFGCLLLIGLQRRNKIISDQQSSIITLAYAQAGCLMIAISALVYLLT
jgi:hypothetical protein